MSILVTGSAGHLGEALMRRLRADGQAAAGLDLKPSPFTDHVGSIGDRAVVRRSLDGVATVLHAATLHKPHVDTHSYGQFLDTNLAGTLTLLEEAAAAGVRSVVFTSTTSAFGLALSPAEGEPAAWITEEVTPVPKNIYGVTKVAAESLCELFARRHGLPVIVLRTSRFFPEPDDDPAVRSRYDTLNAQANELLHRRADLADIVEAHLLAAGRAAEIGFARYIVSATSPFTRDDLAELRRDAAAVVRRLFPDAEALYRARGWRLFPGVDRVYVNDRARRDLGWRPRYDFRHMLDCLAAGTEFRSPLALAVGSKGYHDGTR
ncbi:NAD-dependent epimerase/dehydratase family protein [Azospirillum thermophilum]|uniref:NAD-dependent epimerase n=1 Tax=Azospirillum thermophilum TaxID=2202148 RepID=A0A2S2CY80_9PROT|nr:NAD(P)-dependent oxidoreductase [Azospirillum thermophilum]AWK89473.1 NAD-dependent epimerase [Azospirillum thermophilum]